MPKIKAKKKTGGVIPSPMPAVVSEEAHHSSTNDLPEAPQGEQAPDPVSEEEIPERVELEVGQWLNTVPVVGGADMDVLRLDSGELVARRGGVAGTDEIPEIPELLVPFNGFLVPMGLSIRESNGAVGDRVAGVCKWQITMNGELVYTKHAATLRDALFDAGWAVQRLVEQLERDGVRWWDERTWRHRRVNIGPITCIVVAHRPERGEVGLMAADGSSSDVLDVDILDPHLTWAPLEAPDGTA